MRPRSGALAAAVVALSCLVSAAHAWLVQSGMAGDRVVQATWSEDEVEYRLDAAGSDDLAAPTTLRILRESFAVWDAVSGSRLRLRDGSVSAGRGASSRDGVNVVVFDETGEALGAPEGSGVIAVTRIQSDAATGRIYDADIIFNGRDFRFADTPTSGRVLLRDVAVHEIGHLLGLEHTPLGGAPEVRPTMNPFYFGDGPGEAATLAPDDMAGVRSLYPTAAWSASSGTIEGRVERLEGGGVFGAHVIAEHLDTGALVSTLTGAETGRADAGAFRLRGLPPGPYRLRLEAVAGALDETNFSGLFQGFDTDFPTEYLGNTTDPAAAHVVQLDAGGARVTGVDFIAGFVNPGEPYIVAVDAPGNTPDVAGPYRLRFDIVNGADAEIVLDDGVAGQVLPMSREEAGLFAVDIPGQASGSRVRYRVRATSETGVVTELPADDSWLEFDVIALSGAPLAFTVLRQDGALGIFDTGDGDEVARIAVGSDPIQILPDRDGGRLYVSDLVAGDVAVVDAATFRIVERIAVDGEPLDMALSADGATLFVTNSGDARISAIDVATGEVRAIRLADMADGPFGIAASADALYVTDLNADAVLALVDGTPRSRIPVPGSPRSLAVTPDGARLLVTSFRAGALTLIDTATDTVAAVVDLPVSGGFAVAVHPDGGSAWVTAHAEGAVVAVDLTTLRVAGTIAVGADPRGLSFSPTGERLYVTTAASDEIHIIDTATRQSLGVLAAGGGPRGISVVAAPGAGTGVSGPGDGALPAAPSLSAPWPNPFNAQTQLRLQLRQASGEGARLEVYDILGQRLRVVPLEGLPPGGHVIGWDGRDGKGRAMASGVYVFVVRTPAATLTRKALLLR